jgi:crossover junction endodeoxyribonuclease RusA
VSRPLEVAVGATIELPFPDKILWPNGRGHRMAKHRAFQKHKTWAYHAALAAQVPCLQEAIGNDWRFSWCVTFYPKTRHPVDDDNARASLKAYQDGIAKAIGIDDKLFAAPRIQWGEPVKGGKIVVSLT